MLNSHFNLCKQLLSEKINDDLIEPEFMQDINELERRLDYTFKSKILLLKALTRKSYVNENSPEWGDNEVLEFLGDAVLELIVSHICMEIFPGVSEGHLTKYRAAVVKESGLTRIARMIDLGDLLLISHGEDKSKGRDKPSILSDTLEAIIAAIYLDGGIDASFIVIRSLFKDVFQWLLEGDFDRDYKSRLQEFIQSKLTQTPQYKIIKEEGPDHDKTFCAAIYVGEIIVGKGMGKSKKHAEQNAAQKALSFFFDKYHIEENA